MAVPPHGMLEYNQRDPARRRHRAAVCRARRRSRVGEAARGRRRQRQRRRRLGRQRHGAGRARRLHATSSSSCSTRAPIRTPATAGFTALHAAIMRRDETHGRRAARARRRSERAASRRGRRRAARRSDWNFNPELVGATPFWLAARFSDAGRSCGCWSKHGADPAVVHHVDYHAGDRAPKHRDAGHRRR